MAINGLVESGARVDPDARYARYSLANRITVGASGTFSTLKAAVDWFNASATANTEILLDGGHHLIADTVTVNNSSYALQVRGLGSAMTFLDAATGLTNKPMFKLKTACDINKVSCIGSTLGSYGTASGENFITFDGTSNIYVEITDIIIDTFKIGIADTVGVDLFLFNFILANCGIGVSVDYSTTSIDDTTVDLEVGNFENCPVGVDLVKAEGSNFIIAHIVFIHVNTTDIGVRYDGANFIYSDISNIINCTYNDIGSFTSGIDFTRADGRDANIVLFGNVGQEDKSAHAKTNVINNASATTLTTQGLYYKAVFTNGLIYTCKVTLADGKMTYQPANARDVTMWVSGCLFGSNNGRNIDVALHRKISGCSLADTGATVTVTSTNNHHLQTGDIVSLVGWTGAGTWNGVYSVTVTGDKTFTYVAAGGASPPTGGTVGQIIAPVTVRVVTATTVVYLFNIIAYLPDVGAGDEVELYMANQSQSGETATIVDLSWLMLSQ